MSHPRSVAWWLPIAWAAACSQEAPASLEPLPTRPGAQQGTEVVRSAPGADDPAVVAGAPAVLEPSLVSQRPGATPRFPVVPAFALDEVYAGAGRVQARRLLYRVELRLPKSLRSSRGIDRGVPLAELRVDLSAERLRARFEGALWSVGDGAEARLRTDQPGAYVFDGRGGRPLGAGQLASWFAGGRVRRGPRVRWLLPPSAERGGLGAMICRLLVEWARLELEEGMRRCRLGGALPYFRVGPWAAERTADVVVRLSRRALRADERDPPSRLSDGGAVRWVRSPDVLRATVPMVPARRSVSPGALRVVNGTSRRLLVLLEGSPAVWLDAGAEATLRDMRPGVYRIAAVRPFGTVVLSPRGVRVPAEVVLGRRRPPPTDVPETADGRSRSPQGALDAGPQDVQAVGSGP